MAAIEMWLQQPAAQAVGWALLQFVWQGTVVGLLTAAALLALRRSASDVRYLVSAIGLALMLTLAIVTGVQKYQALQAAEATRGGVSGVEESGVSEISRLKPDVSSRLKPGAPRGSRSGGSAFSESGADATTTAGSLFAALRDVRAEALMPSLMVIWLAGVSLLTLRLLTGWLWVQRLRTRGVAAADESLRRMAARLSRRLRIRRAVILLESSLVDVPTVIGFLKPVVLLPATALGGLTLQQVEAILAHELAHIRRHDYLVNLLQTLVETVLFYHPAVWWVSRRIRIERENCCDDLAVSLCGDPVTYATALAELEAMRSSGPVPERHIAMAATGGSLLQRVRRLLGAPTSHSGRGPAWLAGGVALLLVGGITLGATESQRPLQPVVAAAHDINLDAVPAPAPAQPPAPWRAAAAIAASPAPQPPATQLQPRLPRHRPSRSRPASASTSTMPMATGSGRTTVNGSKSATRARSSSPTTTPTCGSCRRAGG
jgi:beta-lactamase regulating signal transducer with metallopeptidase domain